MTARSHCAPTSVSRSRAAAVLLPGAPEFMRTEISLILFAESLDEGLSIRIEELFTALLPRCSEFGRGDVPVRPAFLQDRPQVLPEIFQSRTSEKPIPVIDPVNDKTGFEDNHVGNHRIVDRIGIFGDVEIFLHDAPGVGQERPVGADPAAIFVRLGDIVGADRNQPAVGNFELTMELNQSFRLPAIFGAETTAAEDKNHRVWSLQVGELSAFGAMVGKLVVGEDGSRNDVSSHLRILTPSMRGVWSRFRDEIAGAVELRIVRKRVSAPSQPKVNEKACTPESRNSISNSRST